jgi:hypothetical protein
MKRTILGMALGVVLALGGSATAAHNPHHKCEVNKAFVVKGVFVDGQTVVTDDGVENVDVTGANRVAKNAGHGPDTANDPGSYSLSDTERSVKLSGYEEGDAVSAGDKIRVLGKVVYNRCTEEFGEVTVRKIRVIDSDDVEETTETETPETS